MFKRRRNKELKTRKGIVEDVMCFSIEMFALTLFTLGIIYSVGDLFTITRVYQTVREGIEFAETKGMVTPAKLTELENAVKELPRMKSVNFSGTTTTPTQYGDRVILQCNYTVTTTKLTIGSLFAPQKEQVDVSRTARRRSISKNG